MAQTGFFPLAENFKSKSVSMFLAGYPGDKARHSLMPCVWHCMILEGCCSLTASEQLLVLTVWQCCSSSHEDPAAC